MNDTEVVIAKIKALAGTIKGEEIADQLGVGYSTVKRIARANNISLVKYLTYGAHDDAIIARNIKKMSYHDIGKLLDRSGDSVRMRASLLGLAGKNKRKTVIVSKDAIINPGKDNIRDKNKWSEKDIAYIVDAINSSNMRYQDLGDKIGRTSEAVRFQYKHFHQTNNINPPGNKKKRQQVDWDEDEIEHLTTQMDQGDFSIAEVAKVLGRTYESVRHKYRKLNARPPIMCS